VNLETSRIRDFVLIATAILLVWQFIVPIYKPSYLLKRAFLSPTFVCKNGGYSYSQTSNGACSGSGGIVQEIMSDGTVRAYESRRKPRRQASKKYLRLYEAGRNEAFIRNLTRPEDCTKNHGVAANEGCTDYIKENQK